VPSSHLETCAHFSPPLSLPQLPKVSHRPIITRRAQILFLGGLFLIIGPQKTFYFFSRKNKLRGTACFLGGILLVFLKWPTIGVLVEMFGFLHLFGWLFFCPPALAHCLMRPFFFFSSRDFFPVILTFLRQLPFIGQFLNLPYIRPVRTSTTALYPNHLTLTCALWPRVFPARGSFSRFPYLRSVTDTTMISYYSTLFDRTVTTVVVNARLYGILETGSGWNEHRASLSSLSSDKSFDVIRSRQHHAFPPTSISCPSRPFLGPFFRVVNAAVPFCRMLRHGCGRGTLTLIASLAICSHRDEPNEKDQVRVPPIRFSSQRIREGNHAPLMTPYAVPRSLWLAKRLTYHGDPDLTYFHVMWHLGLPFVLSGEDALQVACF